MSKYTIVGIGELLWDVFPGGKKLGGAPANFAQHVYSFGHDVQIVSAVGKDDLGEEIKQKLAERGLGTLYIGEVDHPTSIVTVDVKPDKSHTFDIHEGVAWDYIPFTPMLEELAKKADAVFYSGLAQRSDVSMNNIQRFLKETKPSCLRVFDATFRQHYFSKQMVEDSLMLANVFKLSDEELEQMVRLFDLTGTEDEMLQGLVDTYDLKLVALTKGKDGSKLYGRYGKSEHQGYSVKVADTVGAGDSFTATLVVGLLKGKSLDEINEHANKVAAYVCSQEGATPELPKELREWR